MVPFDIQGATIMMPMDIQGQTVDLKVNIVAQTIGNIGIDIKAQTIGNISVNIAASAVTMNVNIAASAVTINMDIKAQSVGVYLQPEWAAKEGTDKDLFGLKTGASAGGEYTLIQYTVPTGKTLCITHLSGNVTGVGWGMILDMGYVDGGTLQASAVIGGSQGCAIAFPKPQVFTEGMNFVVTGRGMAASGTANLRAAVGGYEI
jgi:hypothetical protein